MRCPFCATTRDRVVDSREVGDARRVRRRRECLDCGRRFTTYERTEEIAFRVIKNDGTRADFDRQKLLAGMSRACEKRPVAPRELAEIVDSIEEQLHEREEREMTTREIGSYVMDRLRRLDAVAYVRFASVYRRFEEVGDFVEVAQGLIDERQAGNE